MTKRSAQNASGFALPKLCGADIELGNFIVGMERIGGTGYDASHALIAEIKGLPLRPSSYFDSYWSVHFYDYNPAFLDSLPSLLRVPAAAPT